MALYMLIVICAVCVVVCDRLSRSTSLLVIIANTCGRSQMSGRSSLRYQIQAVSRSVALLVQKSGFFMLSFRRFATIACAYSLASLVLGKYFGFNGFTR